MCRDLRSGVLITLGILMLGIFSGCTLVDDYEDDEYEESMDLLHPEEEYDRPPSAIEVAVQPRPGATIRSDTPFNLAFDQAVTLASVNGAAATGSGRNWAASPALSEGNVGIYVSWENRDGSTGCQSVGPYFVRDPDVTPPVITGGTVRDRERNVDPEPINGVGFRLDFNEPITGSIQLTDEAGVDLNWIANIVDWTATLTPVAGQELVNEATYRIEIDVQDGAGNPLQKTITFVTKPQ